MSTAADSPLLRPQNPFERRVVTSLSRGKPNLSNASTITRALPGGTTVEAARRVHRTYREVPWLLRSDGSIVPGIISLEGGTGGSVIPEINGIPISGTATIPTLTIPENGYLVAKFEFNLSWNGSYLTTPMTLTKVTFTAPSSIPVDEVAIKYRAIAIITGGLASAPFYTGAALVCRLCGNAPNTASFTLFNA